MIKLVKLAEYIKINGLTEESRTIKDMLWKYSQDRQYTMFPPPKLADPIQESGLAEAGYPKDAEGYACIGCGEYLEDEEEVHSFVDPDDLDEEDVELAYQPKAEDIYIPENFYPNFKQDVAKLIFDLSSRYRELLDITESFNPTIPINVEYTLGYMSTPELNGTYRLNVPDYINSPLAGISVAGRSYSRGIAEDSIPYDFLFENVEVDGQKIRRDIQAREDNWHLKYAIKELARKAYDQMIESYSKLLFESPQFLEFKKSLEDTIGKINVIYNPFMLYMHHVSDKSDLAVIGNPAYNTIVSVLKSAFTNAKGSQVNANSVLQDLVKMYKDNGATYLQSAADELEYFAQVVQSFAQQDKKPFAVSQRAFIDWNRIRPRGQIREYPICEDCVDDIYQKCADCGDQYLPSDLRGMNTSEEAICEGCSEHYSSCEDCGKPLYTEGYNEDYRVTEDGEIFCLDCYSENDNNFKELTESLNRSLEYNATWTGETIPVNKNILEKRILPLLKNLFKKYNKHGIVPAGAAQKFFNTLEKQNVPAEDILVLRSFLFEPNDDEIELSKINNILHMVDRRTSRMNNFFEKYSPNVKGLKLTKGFSVMDVEFKVVEPRYDDLQGFTVVMYPGKSLFKAAEAIFGDAGRKAWDSMSGSGTVHHKGAIAYARISNVDGESWVINNMQRDADLQNLGRRYIDRDSDMWKAAKWWDKQVKHWAPTFLLALADFSDSEREYLYMTPFEVQQDKWSTIPERNKDVYDKIPEELRAMRIRKLIEDGEIGGPEDISEYSGEVLPREEHYTGRVERISGDSHYLWRIAKKIDRFDRLRKIAISVQDTYRDRNKNLQLEKMIKEWYENTSPLSRLWQNQGLLENKDAWLEKTYMYLEDLGEVALGNKPAAIISTQTFNYYIELAKILTQVALENGNIIIKVESLVPGKFNYIIGTPENVRAIENQFRRAYEANPKDPPADREYHETLGKNLGYSEEDVQEFLKHYEAGTIYQP